MSSTKKFVLQVFLLGTQANDRGNKRQRQSWANKKGAKCFEIKKARERDRSRARERKGGREKTT